MLQETGRNVLLYLMLSLLLLSMTAVNSYALDQASQERFKAAQEQMQEGSFPTAYAILTDLFREDPGNADVNFSLGRAAFETGRFEEAVMAFERVLMIRPDAIRVKLEMARCYYQLGTHDTAERYFRDVLEAGPPEQVRNNIEIYLDAIAASNREHFFHGIVSAGVDWDDNVNVAPSSSIITITSDLGDLPIRIDKPAGDTISHITADIRYSYLPYGKDLAWKAALLGYSALYTHEKDLDLCLAELRAGPSLKFGRLTWDFYALASHIDLDYDNYSRTYGTGTSLNAILGTYLMIDADLRCRKKNFYDEDARDARNASLMVTPTWVQGPNRIRTSLGVEREDARMDTETYWRGSGSISFERIMPLAFNLLAGYRYQGTWYRDKAELFKEKRQDDVHSYTVLLSRTISRSPGMGFEAIAAMGYTHTDAESTLELYTYSKNVTSLSLTCAF